MSTRIRLIFVAFAALSAFGCPASAADASPSATADSAPRCRALAALKNPDRQADVAITLVPVAVKRDDEGNVIGIDHEIAVDKTGNGASRLIASDDYFIFKAKVTGMVKSAHVAVLDLQTATDHPSVLWPSPDAPPATDAIAADGHWHPLVNGDQPAIFRAEKPYGKEIYKAFATNETTDFASLLSGDDTRAPLTPIGMLIKNAMKGIASAAAAVVSKSGPTQDTVVVQVVPGH